MHLLGPKDPHWIYDYKDISLTTILDAGPTTNRYMRLHAMLTQSPVSVIENSPIPAFGFAFKVNGERAQIIVQTGEFHRFGVVDIRTIYKTLLHELLHVALGHMNDELMGTMFAETSKTAKMIALEGAVEHYTYILLPDEYHWEDSKRKAYDFFIVDREEFEDPISKMIHDRVFSDRYSMVEISRILDDIASKLPKPEKSEGGISICAPGGSDDPDDGSENSQRGKNPDNESGQGDDDSEGGGQGEDDLDDDLDDIGDLIMSILKGDEEEDEEEDQEEQEGEDEQEGQDEQQESGNNKGKGQNGASEEMMGSVMSFGGGYSATKAGQEKDERKRVPNVVEHRSLWRKKYVTHSLRRGLKRIANAPDALLVTKQKLDAWEADTPTFSPIPSGHDNRKNMSVFASTGWVPYWKVPGSSVSKTHVFFDISGSMWPYADWTTKLMLQLKRYFQNDEIWLFSTHVTRIKFNQYQSRLVTDGAKKMMNEWGTGGTSFDAVAQSIIQHGMKRVLVITDNDSGINDQKLRADLRALVSRRGKLLIAKTTESYWRPGYGFHDYATDSISIKDNDMYYE